MNIGRKSLIFFVDHFKNLIPSRLREKVLNSDERSKEFVINVLLSLVMKAANVLAGLLVVPMTIAYINPHQYGIWLTLSSIIGWVLFFDLGLGNGFRNKFAEAKANGDTVLARQYLSTTYFAITMIVAVVYIGVIVLNLFVDWTDVLKVPHSYYEELHKIFLIVCAFTCINMVANVFGALLSADQKTGYAAIIQGVGQYVSLLVIYLLTQFSDGSLISLAIFYSGIPCIVMGLTSIVMFRFSRYRIYAPNYKFVDLSLVKGVVSLGAKFFLIYLCLIAVFQVVNIVISREIGIYAVTQYNIANKYFNIIYMVMIMIITPLWSAFTDAYTKEDYAWMCGMMNKMEKCIGICFVAGLIMLALSSSFYDIWIGDSVTIPFSLSLVMFLFILAQTFGNVYMYMINGIGTVRLQMIIYVAFALLSWPLFTFASRLFGLNGIVLVPALVYFFQGVIGKIQMQKLMNKSASGIWLK